MAWAGPHDRMSDREELMNAPDRQSSEAEAMGRRIPPSPAEPTPSTSQPGSITQQDQTASRDTATQLASTVIRTQTALSTEAGSDLGSHEGAGGTGQTPKHRPTRSLSRLSSKVGHYLALVVAEHPVEQHRQYLRQSQQDELDVANDDIEAALAAINESSSLSETIPASRAASRRSEVVMRWQGAARSVMSSHQMLRDFNTLGDHMATAADKFAAAVDLERQLAANPHKALLLQALERRRLNRFDNFFERLLNELFITGETIFDWFTPAKLGQHRLYFTSGFTFAVFIVFFYMCGEFPFYMLRNPHPLAVDVCLKSLEADASDYGSAQFLRWISPKGATWCFGGNAWLLNAGYLIEWGARWGPAMKAQPYRWFSSWFLHQSFQHILSNMLLFVAVAYQVEEKYGCVRVAVLFFVSALGGNLFSAVFENNCVAVAGASGGVFGMLGLFIGDMVLNFESLRRPIMRCVMMVCFLIYFIVTVATSPAGTSHFSHVGGFICGLFPSFLFLPNLKNEKWEAVLPIAGGVVMLVVYVTMPLVFYKQKFPQLGDCGVTGSQP